MYRTKLLVAGLAVAGVAQAADITIYKQPNFAGGEMTFSRDMPNLAGTAVYDQSKSIVVRSGRWQACSQPNFQGDCMLIESGQYASLPPQINGRIESLREVSQVAEAEQHYRWRYEGGGWRERQDWQANRDRSDNYANNARRSDESPYGGHGAIVLFAEGNSTRYSRDVDNLNRTPYRDGAERLVIREGMWELCALPGYRGFCRTFEPGIYSNLGRFGQQIGSIRRVG
jgi:hypothetical protein